LPFLNTLFPIHSCIFDTSQKFLFTKSDFQEDINPASNHNRFVLGNPSPVIISTQTQILHYSSITHASYHMASSAMLIIFVCYNATTQAQSYLFISPSSTTKISISACSIIVVSFSFAFRSPDNYGLHLWSSPTLVMISDNSSFRVMCPICLHHSRFMVLLLKHCGHYLFHL